MPSPLALTFQGPKAPGCWPCDIHLELLEDLSPESAATQFGQLSCCQKYHLLPGLPESSPFYISTELFRPLGGFLLEFFFFMLRSKLSLSLMSDYLSILAVFQTIKSRKSTQKRLWSAFSGFFVLWKLDLSGQGWHWKVWDRFSIEKDNDIANQALSSILLKYFLQEKWFYE